VPVAPLLEDLGARIRVMEEQGLQVTDILISVVGAGERGIQFPVRLEQGPTCVLVGLGDPTRVVNLDLVLEDQRGEELLRDVLQDRVPVLSLDAPYTGAYTARVLAPAMVAGVEESFFGYVQAFATSHRPVTVRDTLEAALATARLIEARGFQIEEIRWLSLERREHATTTTALSADSEYVVVGVGSQRIRDLNLSVRAPSAGEVGRDTERDNVPIVLIPRSVRGFYTMDLVARRMKGRAKDGHALVMVARRLDETEATPPTLAPASSP
jgi:hypothetical protein